MNKCKNFPITEYKGFVKFYFLSIANNIIKIANLLNTNNVILDYGCGNKIFSKLLKKKKILNYDINPKYSEIKNFENHKFDIVIFNHVLMYLSKKEISKLIKKIKRLNPKCKLILSLSRQNLISKLGMILSLNFDAHKRTISTYDDQLEVFQKECILIKKKLFIFGITDVYYYKI